LLGKDSSTEDEKMVDAAIDVFSRDDIKDILYRQMIALGGFAKCQEKSSLPLPIHCYHL